MISGFMAKSGPLKKATAETLTKLKNYFANGILITGIDETIRVGKINRHLPDTDQYLYIL